MSVYKPIVDRIVAALEAGQTTGNWRLPWRDITLRPHNPVSGTRYRGVNSLMLSIDADRNRFSGDAAWATFKQWQSIGANVRKGEYAVGSVLVWREVKLKEWERDPDTGEERKAMKPIVNNVFHWTQVEGWEPPSHGPDLTGSIAAIDEMVKAYGIAVEEGRRASYSYSTGFRTETIIMPPRATFIDSQERSAQEGYYSTLLHELVHSTGGPHRLGRFTSDAEQARKGSADYAREELVAELGAAFLGADIGIGASSDVREDHVEYIAHWLKHLREDPTILPQSARAAEQAADYLKEFIPPAHRQQLGITTASEEKARQEAAHKARDAREAARIEAKGQNLEGLSFYAQTRVLTCLDEPRVTHTTAKGRNIWGRILDIELTEAKLIDPYAFKRRGDDGVFVREKDIREAVALTEVQIGQAREILQHSERETHSDRRPAALEV